jgi:hypothetical protein
MTAGGRDGSGGPVNHGDALAEKELFVRQRGKSARMSVLHGIAGSLAVLGGFTRRAPGWSQDQRTRRTGGPSQKIARPGHRPLGTNLTFASLVAREWLRRRLPTALDPEWAAETGAADRDRVH